MGKLIDLTGKRFGRLIVVERQPSVIHGKKSRVIWKCRCECGKYANVRSDGLLSGKTRSCGCLQREASIANGKANGGRIKHGESRERLHNIWYLIKYRCEDETSPAYCNYGGRGIKMCSEWSDPDQGYFRFKQWSMNTGYHESLSIDRIDNDGDYSPDNCRWCNRVTQANNKRSNIRYDFNGKSLTVFEWAREIGMAPKTLWRRLNMGWDIERALTQPLRAR